MRMLYAAHHYMCPKTILQSYGYRRDHQSASMSRRAETALQMARWQGRRHRVSIQLYHDIAYRQNERRACTNGLICYGKFDRCGKTIDPSLGISTRPSKQRSYGEYSRSRFPFLLNDLWFGTVKNLLEAGNPRSHPRMHVTVRCEGQHRDSDTACETIRTFCSL